MRYKPLETVVLKRDLPEYGLKAGDLGVVVELYEPDGLEVEFVTASGRTQAVVTLRVKDVKKVGPGDMIAIRQPEDRPEASTYRFEIYRDAKGEYRWRFVAPNGRIMADSGEGYKTKEALCRSLESFREHMVKAEIVDVA